MLEQLPDALGEALDDVRAGLDQTMFHAVDLRQGMASIRLQSLAFADHAPIPQKYTADGAGLSPPLHWSGVPIQATEVVLVVEDADSPTPHPLVHAIAFETCRTDAIEPLDGAWVEGAMSKIDAADPLVAMGRNSYLQGEWMPPDPPPGHGVHRYVFQLFALGPGDALPDGPGRDAVRTAVQQRGLASACLIGTYVRPSGRIDDPLSQAASTRVDTQNAPFAPAA